MARKATCKHCGVKDDTDNMTSIKKGGEKKINHWYHNNECLPAYQKEQAFKDQERKEMDELYETIKRIHGFEVLPPKFWGDCIQRLRNGTYVGKGGTIKKYKQGVKYSTMTQAYKMSEVDILQSKTRLSFQTDFAELFYGFRIMVDKVNQANKKEKRQAQQNMGGGTDATESIAKSVVKQSEYKHRTLESDDNDITEFLND